MAMATVWKRAISATALTVMAATATPTLWLGQAQAAVVSGVVVQGNRRVQSDTIRSIITIQPGQNFDSSDIDESVRQLFSTGLFADVRVRQSGNQLIVDVIEETVIGSVSFIGNRKVQDGRLGAITQTEARSAFDPATVARDEQAIRDAYSAIGRSANVTSETTLTDDGRVDVTFRVSEGDRTKINAINFVGNNAHRRLTPTEARTSKSSLMIVTPSRGPS